jgi:hypothetical protein
MLGRNGTAHVSYFPESRKKLMVEQTQPGARRLRRARWRVFDYEELLKRDKVNLDIFWLRDRSLEESDPLP